MPDQRLQVAPDAGIEVSVLRRHVGPVEGTGVVVSVTVCGRKLVTARIPAVTIVQIAARNVLLIVGGQERIEPPRFGAGTGASERIIQRIGHPVRHPFVAVVQGRPVASGIVPDGHLVRQENPGRRGRISRNLQPAGNDRLGRRRSFFKEHRKLVLGQVHRGISRPVVEIQRMLDGLLLSCVDDVRRFVRIEGDRPHIGILLGGVHVEGVVGSGLIDIPSVRPLLDGKSALNGLEHEFVLGIGCVNASLLDGYLPFVHITVGLARSNGLHGNAFRGGNDIGLSGRYRGYLIIYGFQHDAGLDDGEFIFRILHAGRFRRYVHGERTGFGGGIFREGYLDGSVAGSAGRI